MGLSLFDIAAIFLTLGAVVGWLNLRFVGLSTAVAMLAVGLLGTLALSGLAQIAPAWGVQALVAGLLRQVDFSEAVLRFMLAFLLFAGAMQVDLEELKRRGWTAAFLATAGVVISAAVVGGGFWFAARFAGLSLSPAWCLVFGVLISPTDPVGVLATLKRTSLAPDIRALIEGEALFNDGVGVVLFGAAAAVAQSQGAVSVAGLAQSVLISAGGGAALGLALGLLAIASMRSIDDYPVEVGVTLALATGTYALAQKLGLSGPIAVVVAGLMLGRHAAGEAIREETRRYIRSFWTVIDENLNAVLFLLVGLEVAALSFEPAVALVGACAIVLALLGRWIAMAGPAAVLGMLDRGLKPGLVVVLTWAGVRGGLSVAMALSLPPSPQRSVLLPATYAVVIFSIIVQSLTLEPVIVRLGYGRRAAPPPPAEPGR